MRTSPKVIKTELWDNKACKKQSLQGLQVRGSIFNLWSLQYQVCLLMTFCSQEDLGPHVWHTHSRITGQHLQITDMELLVNESAVGAADLNCFLHIYRSVAWKYVRNARCVNTFFMFFLMSQRIASFLMLIRDSHTLLLAELIAQKHVKLVWTFSCFHGKTL